ncbi:hypothetical protein BS78_03G172900 [Paspalum vaginatum]|nr:hypothetical protein BS78_03G172900 [Paspalum vaginatum]
MAHWPCFCGLGQLPNGSTRPFPSLSSNYESSGKPRFNPSGGTLLGPKVLALCFVYFLTMCLRFRRKKVAECIFWFRPQIEVGLIRRYYMSSRKDTTPNLRCKFEGILELSRWNNVRPRWMMSRSFLCREASY